MIRKPRWPHTLRDLELFAACSTTELRTIATLMTGHTLDSGATLIREHTTGSEFMIITEGNVAVSRQGGGAALPAILGPGAFVGELALLDKQTRSATVTAITPLSLYVSTGPEFAGMLDTAPSIRRIVAQVAAERRASNNQAA